MLDLTAWISRTERGVRFDLRLTPGAGRDQVTGLATDADDKCHLKARVTAVPEKGKANKALIALLSKALRVPKGSIAIVAGETSRMKTVEIAGDGAALEAALSQLASRTI